MPGRGQLKWGDIDDLQEAIDEYFEGIKAANDASPLDPKVPTQLGLAQYLGIRTETISYYTSDRYKAGRSKKPKVEDPEIDSEEVEDNLSFQDITEDFLTSNGDEIDNLKMQVSQVLKKAVQRVEDWWVRFGATSKNPAFSIYYLKAYCGRYDVPIEGDRDKPQVLEVRLSIQPPDQPQQLTTVQPKPLPVIQVLPDRKQQD